MKPWEIRTSAFTEEDIHPAIIISNQFSYYRRAEISRKMAEALSLVLG